MPDTPVRKVTIFVSSPKDVAPERGRVQAVSAKLNREYEGLVRFETVLWEEHFYTAHKSFQPQIPEAVASDIVVSIFWTRIGTELPADFLRMANGKPYPSGTAYELLTALEAAKAKGVPDVYVFRKTADATLPMADAERRRLAQTQLDALEAFWSEWFRSEKGEFKAAFQNFPSTDAFEQQIELLLRQWLETRGLLGARIAWPKEKGSPFPGLAPFEAEYAAVFFGRARVIDETRRRLAGAAEHGAAFLLIVGASGSGKSSLARAGLIPRLTTPGVVASVDLWRVARMKPGEGQAGPLMALATALLAPDALPELAQGDYPTAVSLADNLRRGGAASVQPISSALARVAEAAHRERHADQAPKPALVLLVDQFEELFAQRVSDAERAAFAESLRQLVATGRVWVVATLRADPALKGLKETGASLDLGPPGPAELAEIVRAPAAAAGLAFETNAEKGDLGERLLADAKTADSLPLLQFTLRQLYEQREEIAGEPSLTHAAYDQLGGLAGAIAAEAERSVSTLPPEAVATLPRLLRRLAEPARDGKTLTLREVSRADVASEPSEATLVDALLMARILIARTDADGRPTVRLAHDAVLSSWPRASEAAQASREFYRVRADVEDALRRWQEHGRPKDRLIPSGVPLAEAERLTGDFGPELPASLITYVASSRKRARSRQRLVAAAAIFFLVVALAASVATKIAYDNNDELRRAEAAMGEKVDELRRAEAAMGEKVDELRRAEAAIGEKLQDALLNQSQFLTSAAEVKLRESNFDLASLLARAALPLDMVRPERRVWAPALDVLQQVAQRDSLRMVLQGSRAIFSPDGQHLLIWSVTGRRGPASATLWDVPSGTGGVRFAGHTDRIRVSSGGFSPDGKLIVTASDDKTARVWETRTATAVAVLAHTARVSSAQFSPDGTAILTTSEDGAARLWKAPSFNTPSILSKGGVSIADFSADGQRVVVAHGSGPVAIFDRSTGNKALKQRSLCSGWRPALGPTGARTCVDKVKFATFSPDTNRVLTISKDNVARVWDLGTGKTLFEIPGVQEGMFSPDGKRIVTKSNDRVALSWDAATGNAEAIFKGHEGSVHAVGFSPDGKHVLTASDDAVRVWDPEIDGPIAFLRGRERKKEQGGEFERFDWAAFSPDGRWIVGITGDSEVRVWEWRNRILRGVHTAIFSPDGQYVATASGGSNVAKVLDTATGRLSASLEGHYEEIWSVRFSPDGTRIVTASKDQTGRIWDARTGAAIAVLGGDGTPVVSAGFTADGRRIITTGSDRKTRIWNADTATIIQVLDFRFEAISSDANYAALRNNNTSVDILDLRTGQKVTLDDPGSTGKGTRFSPDGKKAVVFGGQKIHVWDSASGASVWEHWGTSTEGALFSLDGKCIITRTGSGREVNIWDAESGAKLGMLEGHSSWITDFDFSPDGNWIVTASADGTARLWDARTAGSVAVFKGHDSAVESADFSPDGRTMMTTSSDGTAQLWTVLPLSNAELVDYSSLRAARDFTEEERSKYFLPDDDKRAEWIPAKGSFNDCDRLAAHPRDPEKRAWGVNFENLTEEAVAACRASLAEYPQDPRYAYQLGRALEKKGDTAEARELLERAAARGYAAAHNNIGSFYEEGSLGFEQDSSTIAFEGGLLNSAVVISNMYWKGERIAQDRKVAVEWLRRGAAAGSPRSHHRLAYLYEHGEEVDHDLQRALFHWALAEQLYSEAELRGVEPAGTSRYPRVRRIALSRDMPPKEVAQMASEVLRWTPAARQ
jgi:WD40 repeat protein